MKNFLVNFLKFIKLAKEFDVPIEHVVMFDCFGKSLNPKGNWDKNTHIAFWNYQNESNDDFSNHLKQIDEKMDRFYSSLPSGSKKKIVVFIHGGLNSQLVSLERVIEEFENEKSRCELSKEAGYYPIFINWRSPFIHCYWEHLFWLRQGKNRPWLGIFTSWLMLPLDVARAVIRAPIVWCNLLLNDAKTIPIPWFKNEYVDNVAKELVCRRQTKDVTQLDSQIKGFIFRKPPICWLLRFRGLDSRRPNPTIINKDTFPIEIGEDERQCGEMTKNFTMWLLTFSVKYLIAPIIDAFGTSAWNVMLRRTELLFNSEDELVESRLTNDATETNTLANMKKNGGLSVFTENLIKKISGNKNNWEITLVGHSMGTIVANKIIRHYGDQLPIKKIIYLAAADTVENYQETIHPYLLHNKNTEMKHLMLHPRAEEGETNGFDFGPRGSLLVWLDNFLTNPLTLMERTAGRYDNLLPALHNTPQKIRKRISICVFSAGNKAKEKNPQTHSEMASRFRYWSY
jgi:hypothetical protein